MKDAEKLTIAQCACLDEHNIETNEHRIKCSKCEKNGKFILFFISDVRQYKCNN